MSLFVFNVPAQYDIVPKPKSVKYLGSKFELNRQTRLIADDEAGFKIAALLNEYLLKNYGFKLPQPAGVPRNKQNSIVIESQSIVPAGLKDEAYGIYIVPQGVLLAAAAPAHFMPCKAFCRCCPRR